MTTSNFNLCRMAWAVVCGLCWRVASLPGGTACDAAEPAAGLAAEGMTSYDDGELARKADILHSPRWQRAITELGSWLTTQSVYTPTEVQRIKVQFNARVAAMSSFELEYLLDSISAKLQLLETPEARDAKAACEAAEAGVVARNGAGTASDRPSPLARPSAAPSRASLGEAAAAAVAGRAAPVALWRRRNSRDPSASSSTLFP